MSLDTMYVFTFADFNKSTVLQTSGNTSLSDKQASVTLINTKTILCLPNFRTIVTNKPLMKGSLTVWAIYAYFSDSQNAAFELLVWCM